MIYSREQIGREHPAIQKHVSSSKSSHWTLLTPAFHKGLKLRLSLPAELFPFPTNLYLLLISVFYVERVTRLPHGIQSSDCKLLEDHLQLAVLPLTSCWNSSHCRWPVDSYSSSPCDACLIFCPLLLGKKVGHNNYPVVYGHVPVNLRVSLYFPEM